MIPKGTAELVTRIHEAVLQALGDQTADPRVETRYDPQTRMIHVTAHVFTRRGAETRAEHVPPAVKVTL